MQQEEYSKFESFTKEGEFAKGLDLNQGTEREMTRIESNYWCACTVVCVVVIVVGGTPCSVLTASDRRSYLSLLVF